MESIPCSVLLVIPHEDDGEGGAGGTVAKWVKQGAKAVFVLCTNGDKGTTDPSMTSARLAKIRQEEQRAAAAVLGVHEVVFLRHRDGELEDSLELRRQVTREIRRHKPEVVFCIDPFRTTSHTHRDHRVSGLVGLDSVFTYSWSHHHFPEQIAKEGLQPHRVYDVYLWGSERLDTYFDISETVDLKAAALAKHASQMREPEKLPERIRNRAAELGKERGIPFAEAFRHVHVNPGFKHWAEY
jgi:LmbE family N-acetylglucosaminyl deacetylase